jgi:hypothetical protein
LRQTAPHQSTPRVSSKPDALLWTWLAAIAVDIAVAGALAVGVIASSGSPSSEAGRPSAPSAPDDTAAF